MTKRNSQKFFSSKIIDLMKKLIRLMILHRVSASNDTIFDTQRYKEVFRLDSDSGKKGNAAPPYNAFNPDKKENTMHVGQNLFDIRALKLLFDDVYEQNFRSIKKFHKTRKIDIPSAKKQMPKAAKLHNISNLG